MSKMIAIAAVDLAGLIGYENRVPWNKKADMKRFSRLTKTNGGIIVMGRKTFESIGKPLKDRTTCVISRDPGKIKGLTTEVQAFTSLFDLVQLLRSQDKSAWICGGAEIYRDALLFDLVDEIDLTILNGVWLPPSTDSLAISKEKSVYFPQIPYNFSIESEEVNEEDKSLLHRRYKKIIW